MLSYEEFLKSKKITDKPTGFVTDGKYKNAFDFQADIVKWGCRRGRAAFFEDCGLGKTGQQLALHHKILEHTGENQIIFAPLEVSFQTVKEGKKFGIDCNWASCQDEVKPGITVTNYGKIHRFDRSKFGGGGLDESSIVKSYEGAFRNLIIEFTRLMAYRSAWTATAAPNDHVELGNHAEYLGVMSRTEMLATFFVHDGGDTSKWRLKGHAVDAFWKWVCSWAVNIRKPSDLGYDDGKFKLPELKTFEHIVHSSQKLDGYLFALPASSLQERRVARRESLSERVDKAAELADGNQWVFWCNLNSESAALAKILNAEEVRGDTSDEERERIMLGFLDGSIKRVVTKGSLWGFGMNLQCCQNTALVGLSDSYEMFYQIVRRFWRFGQEKPVNAHIIISDLEGAVLANIKRKQEDATRMGNEMLKHMAAISTAEIKSQVRETIEYKPTQKIQLPKFL